MFTRGQLKLYLVGVLLILAACAPADLDITPTVDPEVQAVTEVQEEDTNGATDTTRALLDQVLSRMPETMGSATGVQWSSTGDAPFRVDRDGGVTARVTYTERQGGEVEFTIGSFNDDESTMAFYDNRAGDTRLLQGAPRDVVPEPNLFGRSNFGSMAVWTKENVVMVVVIQINISTFGDVLSPLASELDQVVDETLETFEG